MDELLHHEGMTAGDIAQAAHDRARMARFDRAWEIYQREIINHIPHAHRVDLLPYGNLIVETIAGVLPIEGDATV